MKNTKFKYNYKASIECCDDCPYFVKILDTACDLSYCSKLGQNTYLHFSEGHSKYPDYYEAIADECPMRKV